jgi:hypothetical protein
MRNMVEMRRLVALGFAAALAACAGGDSGEPPTVGVGGAAGSGGADAAPDGAEGSVGTDAAPDGADGSVGTDAAPDRDSSLADGQQDAAADAGQAGVGIFAGTVGLNSVKLVAFDFANGDVAGTATINASFGDAVPVGGVARSFLMLRSDSKVLVLDASRPWIATKTIDVGVADAAMGTNPHAVVDTGTKAYVALYGTNRLAIIDPAAGTVTGQIDLSAFADVNDPDGLVDVFDGVYDAANHRAYFLLQRTDQNEWGIAPDFVNTCLPVAPLVISIDTANDAVVDLNGATAGNGIELLGKNPGALVPYLAGGKLMVVEAGCHDSAEAGAPGDANAGASLPRRGRGIEVVDLAAGTSAWIYEHTQPGRLDNLVWIDGAHAFVSVADASYKPHWFAWDPAKTVLGAEDQTFPRFWPRHVGGRKVIGTEEVAVDGGTLRSLIAFDVDTRQTTTLAVDLYQGPGANEFSPWAFVR